MDMDENYIYVECPRCIGEIAIVKDFIPDDSRYMDVVCPNCEEEVTVKVK